MKITKRQLRRLIREASFGDWIPGIEGEDEKAEREDQEKVAERHPMAFKMYKALKGIGTSEKVVRHILQQVGETQNIKQVMQKLLDDFDAVAASRGDDGDLVDWLRGDGMDLEATVVEYVSKGIIRK